MLTHPEWWQLTLSARHQMRFEPVAGEAPVEPAVAMGVRSLVCSPAARSRWRARRFL